MSMDPETKASLAKGGSAWVAVFLADLGINSWGDVAAMMAALYSLVLICEWVWKRLLRPMVSGRSASTSPDEGQQ